MEVKKLLWLLLALVAVCTSTSSMACYHECASTNDDGQCIEWYPCDPDAPPIEAPLDFWKKISNTLLPRAPVQSKGKPKSSAVSLGSFSLDTKNLYYH